tara:strand:+ start:450 stop:794 length:345 start_codon:yes stop_codon:yes gene_type:complete
MRELRRKITVNTEKTEKKPNKDSDRRLVLSILIDRGQEVLEIAERQFPSDSHWVVKRIADLYRQGVVRGMITGGDLLGLFRRLGFNVRVKTKISVEDSSGKFVSLSDKLKSDQS